MEIACNCDVHSDRCDSSNKGVEFWNINFKIYVHTYIAKDVLAIFL